MIGNLFHYLWPFFSRFIIHKLSLLAIYWMSPTNWSFRYFFPDNNLYGWNRKASTCCFGQYSKQTERKKGSRSSRSLCTIRGETSSENFGFSWQEQPFAKGTCFVVFDRVFYSTTLVCIFVSACLHSREYVVSFNTSTWTLLFIFVFYLCLRPVEEFYRKQS